jgi:hypothetical protein
MSFTYITTTSAITASVLIPGYMMDKTTNVYLSSSTLNIPGTLTSINNFTTNPLVSATFPAISAYSYPYFTAVNKNHVAVNVYGLSGSGYVDVIAYNKAGYTKLSDAGYLIRQ